MSSPPPTHLRLASGALQSTNDNFTLYDLRVEAVCPSGQRVLCGAKKGDYFTLEGEMMYLPPGQGISIYSLGTDHLFCRSPPFAITTFCRHKWLTLYYFTIASILPLLAAKQRPSARNDWMSTDAEIACPDPNCPSKWRIARTNIRTFSRAETTVVALPPSCLE